MAVQQVLSRLRGTPKFGGDAFDRVIRMSSAEPAGDLPRQAANLRKLGFFSHEALVHQ